MKSALKGAFSVIMLLLSVLSHAVEYNDAGTSKTYELKDGDVLNINSGTFTGTIGSFAINSSINVKSGATFRPSSFIGNAAGTFNNYGTITLTTTTSQAINNNNSSLKLNNYGSFSAHDVLVGNSKVVNYAKATIWLNSLKFTGILDNSGAIYVTNAVTFDCNTCSSKNSQGASLYAGSIDFSTGFTNDGYIYSKSTFRKSGGSTFTNNCTLVSSGDMTFSAAGAVNNNGFMIALQGLISNTTIFTNGSSAHVQGVNFTNGTSLAKGEGVQLKGSGNFLFTGTTDNLSKFFGADGTSTSYINFYDQTPTTNAIVDNNQGKISNTVTNRQVYAIDTATAKSDCNTSVMRTTLPVKLLGFDAAQETNGQLAVRWSVAEQVDVHYFEVEWSRDGNTFSPKAKVYPTSGGSVINYAANVKPESAPTHYLRLKVVNENGTFEYSQVKLLRSNVATAAKDKFTISLNPARTQTTILLTGYQQEPGISVELISPAGQVVLVKQVKDPASSYAVNLSGLERFPSGLYYLRINGSKGAQTQKLLIQ